MKKYIFYIISDLYPIQTIKERIINSIVMDFNEKFFPEDLNDIWKKFLAETYSSPIQNILTGKEMINIEISLFQEETNKLNAEIEKNIEFVPKEIKDKIEIMIQMNNSKIEFLKNQLLKV